MNNAFITFYKKYNDGGLEIFNGFSFTDHLIEGDHIFVEENDDVENLKSCLTSYDNIYCTTSFTSHADKISRILDDRWLVGGRIHKHLSWKNPDLVKVLEKNFYDGPFEEYLGYPLSNTFTAYWNDLIDKTSPTYIGYNAICGVYCNWRKCKFCRAETRYTDVKTNRNAGLVYQQLPEYNFPSVSMFYCGSVPHVMLKDLSVQKRKSNVRVHLQIMANDDIKNTIEKSDNLNNLLLSFGLETLSEKAAKILNKGVNVKNTLECAKAAADRGAFIQLYFMSELPFTDDIIVKESLENIEWMKKNFTDNFLFFDVGSVKWSFKEDAEEFGPYDISYDPWGLETIIMSRLSDDTIKKCLYIKNSIEDAGFPILNKNVRKLHRETK